MTNYTKTTNFTAKDALATTDPEKIILGADMDTEFDNIETASASKFDAAGVGLASLAQAQAETSDVVWMSPLKVANWSDANDGVVGDLHALSAIGADRLLAYDFSATAAVAMAFEAGSGLSMTATPTLDWDATGIAGHDLFSDFVANEHIDHTSVTITAGAGLSYSVGGGDISASATLDMDLFGLEDFTDPAADRILFFDDTDNTIKGLTVGAGLDLTGTTLTADTSSAGLAATEAEAIAGTASNVFISPSTMNDVFFCAEFISGSTIVTNESAGWSPTAADAGTGRTTVTHGLGTADYVVVVCTADPTTPNNFASITAQGATTFEIQARSGSSSGALVDGITVNCIVMKH